MSKLYFFTDVCLNPTVPPAITFSEKISIVLLDFDVGKT